MYSQFGGHRTLSRCKVRRECKIMLQFYSQCYNRPRSAGGGLIELNIPGRGLIQLRHLVSDVNGTLAFDGVLLPDVSRALTALRDRLELHLLTADTHGRQAEIDRQLGLEAVRIAPGGEAEAKAGYVNQLGAESAVAIGQGANDAAMLETAAIGIAVLSREGLATEAATRADVLVPDVLAGLDLLEHPLRLVATLRR
jgi:soluble P-type ATPase